MFDAELSSLSHSTWTTIAFTLNALVFIFLGIELTQVFSPVWGDGLYPNGLLLAIIVLISVMLFVIRFISISLFMYSKMAVKSSKTVERDLDLNIWRCKGNSQFGYDFYFAIFNQ